VKKHMKWDRCYKPIGDSQVIVIVIVIHVYLSCYNL
jgi:hypothetical protein